MIIGNNQVMEVSNLTSRFDNSDFDGDSLIALALHSEEAREDFKYAYVRNLVEFEHMDELLIDYEHESIYSSYMLTLKAQIDSNQDNNNLEDISLFDKNFNLEDIKNKPNFRFYVNDFNRSMTIIEIVINQMLFRDIIKLSTYRLGEPLYLLENGLLTKKNLTILTMNFWKIISEINYNVPNLINFWDVIHEFDKFLLECSGSISFCSPSFNLEDFAVKSPIIDEFKENLLTVEPFLAFHQNLILFEKVSNVISENPDNILNLVFKSGARLKSVQLLKAASNTGIPTDIYGKAFPANIKNSLLDGLTPEEYFITGDSARLALAVRQEAIPKGGELQRKFFFTTGILKWDRDVEDCGSEKFYKIKVKNKTHLSLLNHRWHHDENQGLISIDILDTSLIGKYVNLRSPMTCKNKGYKICQKCMGDKLPESTNLGSTVGAALSEGIIQSVLRTHHFGGAFIANEDKHLLDIMRRSEFRAPDTIIGQPEDIEYIIEYLQNIYLADDWEHEILPINDKTGIKITIHNLPFNDDSVKQLNNIVGLIDKNRDAGGLIDPAVLYEELQLVIEQNNILSLYLELIISLLYYDEDGILYRYSDKEAVTQIALKNVVEILDPKLSIFYNFSNRIISKIYNHEPAEKIDHMYHDLLGIYK